MRECWGCAIPDTLCHGDLHPGNVAYDGNEVRIFDWTHGCVTHPFLDGSHLARVLELAPLADHAFQTVTFADIATAAEDGSGDFTGTVARMTSALLDLVR